MSRATAGLSKSDEAAIAAVARQYAARWDGRYLTRNGRQIALEIVALRQKDAPHGQAKPKLRFDRVVLQLFATLRAAASEVVAADQAVIVTVTAPVRLGGKTATAIVYRISDGLGRSDIRVTIHGNRVCLRRIDSVPSQMPRLIGFVHNPDTNPAPILDLTQRLMRRIDDAVCKRTPRSTTRERWLVLTNQRGHPYAETYRRIWEQIAMPTGFAKILVVLADGAVEDLTA